MIYTIAELLASLSDCIIMLLFLIKSLSFKKDNRIYNYLMTALFVIILQSCITIINSHLTLEGIFSIAYILILFLFSRILLKQSWQKQLLLVLIGVAGIFLVSTLITVISSFLLKEDYSILLQMRNPIRIIILILSKLLLIAILYPISKSIQKQRLILQPMQTITSIVSLLTTIIVGITIEKMILEQYLPTFYASIIMSCLIVINILLFAVVNQLSLYNISSLNQAILETRLHDEEKKLQESIQLTKSIKILQHDLNNHIIAVTHFIENGDTDSALDYMQRMSISISKVPIHTHTGNSALNSILDVKRMICMEHNINLKCYIDDDLPDFEPYSFNIVFGNLMDNAIEAEIDQADKEIRISIDTFSSYLHLIIQNRISQPVLINGEMPPTKKDDVQNHGLGLMSVKDTLATSNGSIDFYEHDGWLIAEVLLPYSLNA